MSEKLQITDDLYFDDAVTKQEYHAYYPISNNFNLNDEVRIPVRQEDLYSIPGDSFLYIEGKFIEDSVGTGTCKLTNNAYAFLFEQIRYEINGVEVDRCNNPGITSAMKAYVSYSDNESKALQMAGWCPSLNTQPTLSNKDFSASIPLSFLCGVFEDFRKILINVNQELILLRSRTDNNSYMNTLKDGTKKAKIEITKIMWQLPHIVVNDESRLQLLKTLNANKPIYIPYRAWELHQLPTIRENKMDIWPIKTSTNMERPRYVIVAFQTEKKDNINVDATDFDHVSTSNLKLYLNSNSYPYDKLNLQMNIKRYTTAYRMYAAFQSAYYNKPNQPILDYEKFLSKTLYVIDCSKQNESIKSSTVDIKLEMECDTTFPPNTTVFCLIIHDSVMEYLPLTGIVKKII